MRKNFGFRKRRIFWWENEQGVGWEKGKEVVGKKRGGERKWQICWVTTRIRIWVRGEDNAFGAETV